MSDQTGNTSGQPHPDDQPYGEPGQQGQSGGEPTAPYGQPYGQSSTTPSPYGSGQPSSYGQPEQSGYGQPGYGQPAYGQPTYGQPPYGAAYGQPAPDKRPATVTVAGVVTIVFSSLALLLFLLVFVVLFAGRSMFAQLEDQPGFPSEVPLDSIVAVVAVFIGIFVLWAIAAIVLAVFTMRRSNAARIMLVISAAVVGLFSFLGIFGQQTDTGGIGFSLVMVAATVGTIVCLFTGGASEWFARRSGGGGGPVQTYGGGPVA